MNKNIILFDLSSNKTKIKNLKKYIINENVQNFLEIICLFFKMILLLFLLFFYFLIKDKEPEKIPTKNDFAFIVCLFAQPKLRSDHRIFKYFHSLNDYVPQSKVIFIVSKFTIIDHNLLQFKNLNITIERYGRETVRYLLRKYKYRGVLHDFFVYIRPFIYIDYLYKHPEIKYVCVCDDDTLFFRDPFFLLIQNHTNEVHIMEDIFPFTRTVDLNYIWTNQWVQLNNSIKEKCDFKILNKTLLSDDIKNRIPLNSGLMIGKSTNLIKIFELLVSKYECTHTFPFYSDQGLLNYFIVYKLFNKKIIKKIILYIEGNILLEINNLKIKINFYLVI